MNTPSEQSESQEHENILETHQEIDILEIARWPREADVIVVTPEASDEIKYMVTSVGQEMKPVMTHSPMGVYTGTKLQSMWIVRFTYTIGGQSAFYARDIDHFFESLRHLQNKVDVIKCYRRA